MGFYHQEIQAYLVRMVPAVLDLCRHCTENKIRVIIHDSSRLSPLVADVENMNSILGANEACYSKHSQ